MSILITLLLALIMAHGSQFLLHHTLHPRSLRLAALLQQSIAVSSIYLIALLLTHRPFLSLQITLSVLAVFLVVNHAKYQALKEPLVFSDVYLYIQVVRHPRLFLPFLNIPVTLTAIVIGLILLYFAISLEAAISTSGIFYPTLIALLLTCIAISRKLALQAQLTCDLVKDIKKYGFFNNLLNYAFQAENIQYKQALAETIIKHSPFAIETQGTQPSPAKKPNIITIQSESFFDARRLYPGINTKILQNYDQLKTESLAKGTLTVPAWGANTLRPEFAFLSGIDNRELRHYRFNPYQYLQNTPTPTIASHLQSQGYRCIAIHPNSSTFFGRNKVFPLFGFDEFIDSDDFDPAATSGPYISDLAVEQKIEEIIDRYAGKQPLFIFVITMENHGPLHLETVAEQDTQQYYQSSPPKQHSNLTVYLRHLSNADQMLKKLSDYLKSQQQETLLCFYGDHVPSIPAVYDELEFSDGRTDYLIWHSHLQGQTSQTEALSVHQLALKSLTLVQELPIKGDEQIAAALSSEKTYVAGETA